MIARRWTALAAGSEQADAYVAHFEGMVRPHLESTRGFLGAAVERVKGDGGIEIVVVTRWESMDAIKAFAGEDIDLAVVEPEARAVLSGFDDRVRHIELADGQAFGHLEVIDIPAEAAGHTPWFNESSHRSTKQSSGSGWSTATFTGTSTTTKRSSFSSSTASC